MNRFVDDFLLEGNPNMEEQTPGNEFADLVQPEASVESAPPPAAWEMIENGRYQPRRIKGSCVGRELG